MSLILGMLPAIKTVVSDAGRYKAASVVLATTWGAGGHPLALAGQWRYHSIQTRVLYQLLSGIILLF